MRSRASRSRNEIPHILGTTTAVSFKLDQRYAHGSGSITCFTHPKGNDGSNSVVSPIGCTNSYTNIFLRFDFTRRSVLETPRLNQSQAERIPPVMLNAVAPWPSSKSLRAMISFEGRNRARIVTDSFLRRPPGRYPGSCILLNPLDCESQRMKQNRHIHKEATIPNVVEVILGIFVD